MRRWLTAVAGAPLAQSLVGAGAVCVYLALRVDPSVFYEHAGYFPPFHYGTEFLRPFLARPGGPSQYVAAYLAQACSDRWLGAGVLAALALLLGWGYALCLRYAAGKRTALWMVPPVLAAVLVWTRYGFHLDSITALALALLAAAAYAHPRIDAVPPRRRGAAAVGLLVLGYWLCGGAAYVCVLLIAAVEHQRRRQPRLSALLLLSGLLIPVGLGHLTFALPLREAATRLLPYSDTSRLEGGLALCLLYGLAVLPSVVLFLKHDVPAASNRAGKRSGPRRRSVWGRITPRWQALVGVAGALAVIAAAWPAHTARRLAVMKHCRARQWDRVLAAAATLPADRFTLDVSYAVNLALYHTGQLGQSMFTFPQGPRSLSLGTAFASAANRAYYSERPKAVFDTGLATLEMGLANEAEHVAHEAVEIYGPHPTILKQLAFVNLVKRRPEAARVFLQALCQDPVARPWARATLASLDRAPTELLDGEWVTAMRANLAAGQDSNAPMLTLAERCRGQLEANPRNRMAFEYLMGQHLITHDLEGFVRALPGCEALGILSLPRHYQEAVLLYEATTGKQVPRWSSQVDPEIRERFRQFAAVVAPRAGPADPGQALAAADAFVGTYFHHYVFQQTE